MDYSKMSAPEPGDKIRCTRQSWRGDTFVTEHTLEVFRYTLGFFEDDCHREAGEFTPLSDPELWVDGPDTFEEYISNFGPYKTNLVQAFEVIKEAK